MARDPDRPGGGGDEFAARAPELEAFFRATRARPDPEPGIDLLSAIFADAAEVSASRNLIARPRARLPEPVSRGWLPGWLTGWPTVATLGTCALLGFWLGLAGPSALDFQADLSAANAEATSGETDVESLGDFFDMASLSQ